MNTEKNVDKEEQLQKLKWQFSVENSNIGVWDWDNTNNQDLVFYSKESKAILGYKEGEYNNFGSNPQDWNDRVHPEDQKKYFQDFQDHLNGLYPIYQNKYRVLANDGTYRWILDKGKVIEKDSLGNPLRVIGTHVDITDCIENDSRLKKSLNLVTGQNKKLRNFAHIVTHNLKEHSGNFRSLLEFYDEAKNKEDKEESIAFLKILSSSLDKTITNLNRIVSIDTKKELEIEKIYISEYIKRAIDLLDIIIIEHNVTINNLIDERLFVNFSPAYMESIIQNLLSNAIKYKHPERSPIITLNASIDEDSITIEVSDNGLGVNLEKYGNAIFGLYKTFHHNENAEGVGLYLIKSQIESFGGSIHIESDVGVGSKFIIEIPNKTIE
jgi:PAS domain S-box-containing protein